MFMAPHSLSIFVCWHVSMQKLKMCKIQSLIFSDENHECSHWPKNKCLQFKHIML